MAASGEEVLLEGEFLLFPKKKGIYKVTLTRRRLYYTPVSSNNTVYEEKFVQISDIIGCHLLQKGGNIVLPGAILPSSASPKATSKINANLQLDRDPEQLIFPSQQFLRVPDYDSTGFVIFAYPFKKKMFSTKKCRSRLVVAFETMNTSVNEKMKGISVWQKTICLLARDILVNKDDILSCELPPQKKMLILINPYSGPGKAYTIFKSEIAPMLYEANIPYTALITDHAGHASELMKEIQFSDWYGVVIVSGDGLIFETVNGIMQRDDWASSIKVPIGCLPGGSGNALCCSINYAAGEPLDSMVLHSTFILAKHHVVPMDLVIVQLADRAIYSFLSVTWGIMADIDYESEKYRNLGEARFTLGAIRRILNLRSYRGKISFLPVAEYAPVVAMHQKKVLTKVRRFSLRSRSSSKNTLDSKESSSPRMAAKRSYSMDNSGVVEHQLRLAEADQAHNGSMQYKHEECMDERNEQGCGDGSSTVCATSNHLPGAVGDGEANLEKMILDGKASRPKSLSQTDSNSINMTILAEAQEVRVEEETYLGNKSDFSAVPTPLLPPLDQPLPDNWVTLEGEFILMAAVYQTHLGSDMLAAPDAHLCDGHINLMMVREGISRNALLNLFLSFGQGSHVHSPYVDSVKVLAFRLEPATMTGNIMIDGERFDPSPLQAQILPGLARVMAIK